MIKCAPVIMPPPDDLQPYAHRAGRFLTRPDESGRHRRPPNDTWTGPYNTPKTACAARVSSSTSSSVLRQKYPSGQEFLAIRQIPFTGCYAARHRCVTAIGTHGVDWRPRLVAGPPSRATPIGTASISKSCHGAAGRAGQDGQGRGPPAT